MNGMKRRRAMSYSRKRGWLWIALIGVTAIIIVIVWPHKNKTEIDSLEILPDSIIETPIKYKESDYPEPKQKERKISTKKRQQINYNKLYAPQEKRPSKYDNFKVKINGSDTNDWKELKGIGSAYARRIVNYRKSLGGYYSKAQLKEVYGMTDELYHLIEPHLIENGDEITPINLNSAELNELKRHPYLDYYQAKAIVNYREKIGKFNSIDEVLNVSLIDTTTFNKIKIYLTI